MLKTPLIALFSIYLSFSRWLRWWDDFNLTIFSRYDQRGVRLHVEMLLSTAPDVPLQDVIRVLKALFHVPSLDAADEREEGVLLDGLLQ